MLKLSRLLNSSVLSITTLTVLFSAGIQSATLAGETVLEKINRTGVITAGVRTDAAPFAFQDRNGEFMGYSVEMLHLIEAQAEKELGKDVTLRMIAVDTAGRFNALIDGQIDIECGATSFTWGRDQNVDFSISYFATGTRFLTKKGMSRADIKKVGVIPGTSNESVVNLIPGLTAVSVANRQEGFKALKEGKIDALASDAILLETLRQADSNADAYEIVPGDRNLNTEAYACIVPEDDSDWRDLVNLSLATFMQRMINGDSQAESIYERWFSFLPQTEMDDYFRNVLDSTHQVRLD